MRKLIVPLFALSFSTSVLSLEIVNGDEVYPEIVAPGYTGAELLEKQEQLREFHRKNLQHDERDVLAVHVLLDSGLTWDEQVQRSHENGEYRGSK